MQRDMELIRDLLFRLESAEWGFVDTDSVATKLNVEQHVVSYHLKLLYQAGYIEGQVTRGAARREFNDKIDLDMDYVVSVRPWSLTWQGHEYLETVRDPETWKRVKKSAAEIGSFSIETIKALAAGFIKTKIKAHTGIEV